MNEDMVPGEREIDEIDAGDLEREMNAAPDAPAPTETPAEAPAEEVDIATVAVDGKDVPVEDLLTAYRNANTDGQTQATVRAEGREQLRRVVSSRARGEATDPPPIQEPEQPAPQAEAVEIPQTLQQAERIEQYLLLNELEGLAATHGEFDQEAVCRVMVDRGIDDAETALFVARGMGASQADAADSANAAADAITDNAGNEAPSTSTLTPTETPDVSGMSWKAVEADARADVSRRGSTLIS